MPFFCFLNFSSASSYVLIGVIISGFFSLLTSYLSNKNTRELKEIENKNDIEIQKLNIDHNNEIKKIEEDSKKSLRLLDDRLKVFSEFQNNFSEILISGSYVKRHEKIENLRKDTYKTRLLASSANDEFIELDHALMNFSNYYLSIIRDHNDDSQEERSRKIDEFIAVIKPMVNKISEKLVNEL